MAVQDISREVPPVLRHPASAGRMWSRDHEAAPIDKPDQGRLADPNVVMRLHRMAGQAAGLARMYEAGRPTEELLDQMGALRGAIVGAATLITSHEVSERCSSASDARRGRARMK